MGHAREIFVRSLQCYMRIEPGLGTLVTLERNHRRGVTWMRLAAIFAMFLASLVAAAAIAKPPVQPVEIVAVEVTFKGTNMPPGIDAVISRAAFEEQSWYRVVGAPVVMQVHVDQLKTKTVGAALAQMFVPFVDNKNEIRAHIRLVDRATGGEVHTLKAKATDELDKSISLGDIAKGVLSFSGYAELLFAAGEGANRNLVGAEMARNLMAVVLAKLHGKAAAKIVVKQKKAAAKLAKAAGLPVPRMAADTALPTERGTSNAGNAIVATVQSPPILSPKPMDEKSDVSAADMVGLDSLPDGSAAKSLDDATVAVPIIDPGKSSSNAGALVTPRR